MRAPVLVVALALAYSAAWGADVVVEGGAHVPERVAAAEMDGELELGWDNGTRRWSMAWYTGAGSWVGNEFNLSTLSTYLALEKVRFYTRDGWPNVGWDGFSLAVYNFGSGMPGARLWPTSGSGYFFKPTGLHGHVWVEIPVGWTTPSTSIIAAVDQCYNYPTCDPRALDSNLTFRGRSWQYYTGTWAPLNGYQGYRNLMLRIVVNDATLDVAPTSIGRVKALYH